MYYRITIDYVSDSFGIDRSSINMVFMKSSVELLCDSAERRFKGDRYLVVCIDRIEYSGETIVSALAIKSNDVKKLLGIHLRAMKNPEVYKELLQSLVDHGPHTNKLIYLVINGSRKL